MRIAGTIAINRARARRPAICYAESCRGRLEDCSAPSHPPAYPRMACAAGTSDGRPLDAVHACRCGQRKALCFAARTPGPVREPSPQTISGRVVNVLTAQFARGTVALQTQLLVLLV